MLKKLSPLATLLLAGCLKIEETKNSCGQNNIMDHPVTWIGIGILGFVVCGWAFDRFWRK